jgi:hypothetical protein
MSQCPGRKFASNEIATFTTALLMYLDIKQKTTELPKPDITRATFGMVPPASPFFVEMSLKPQYTF